MPATEASPNPASPSSIERPARIDSVDIMRGIVMVVMALDHVRDYMTNLQFQPEDMDNTFAALFFTRWITHFCAPSFFFLAGAGAYLQFLRGKSIPALSTFLWKRGLWLVLLELTVVFWGWTFLPLPGMAMIVIWALGWSMVALAGLVRLPVKWVGIIGVVMIATHNLADNIKPEAFGKLWWLWATLHVGGFYPVFKPVTLYGYALPSGFFVVYPLIPWIGVMAAGFAFGKLYERGPEDRRRIMVWLGAAMFALFVLLRATNWYGNAAPGAGFNAPGPFTLQRTAELTIIKFFNVEKYPPSLDFLLMTLGPVIMALAWFDKIDLKSAGAAVARFFIVFGRVPMFYYLIHIYAAHLMAVLVAVAVGQPWHNVAFGGFMVAGPSPGYGQPLGVVWLAWIALIIALYFPCRWYMGVKQRRKDWWLSYL